MIPESEALRRAIRWLGSQPRHDTACIEQASLRFDLTPKETAFLLRNFRGDEPGTPPPAAKP